MKKRTKIWAMVAAGAMILSLSATALAAPAGPDEQAANGHTTIGVMEAKNNPKNVSFEVPLYVTMAAVAGQTDVQMPTTAYKITNSSTNADGNVPGYSIAVTSISFQAVKGGTWGITPTVPTTGAGKVMQLSIGGVPVDQTVAAGGANPAAPIFLNTNVTGSVFYNTVSHKPEEISADPAVGNSLTIPLSGKIADNAVAADAPASPQFKVKYTISAVGENHDVIGKTYVGNDSREAGFGDWNGTGWDPVPSLAP